MRGRRPSGARWSRGLHALCALASAAMVVGLGVGTPAYAASSPPAGLPDPGSTPVPGGTPRSAPPAGAHPGGYVRVSPTRVAAGRTLKGHHSTHVTVATGRSHVPSHGVSAVVLTVTATSPKRNGTLVVFGAGHRPHTTSVSFGKGESSTATVVTPVHRGRITVYNTSSGKTHVSVDVAGYFVSGGPSVAGGFVRVPATHVGSPSVTGHHTRRVHVATAASHVPGSGAAAVVLSVTATRPRQAGSLTVYGAGPRPRTTSLSFTRGHSATANVVSAVAGGSLSVYSSARGTTHVSVDVVGYFRAGAPRVAGGYVPITPTRVPTPVVTGGHDRHLSLSAGVVPHSATAVALGLTANKPAKGGSLVAYAGHRPHTTSLTFTKHQSASNTVIAPLSHGRFSIHSSARARTHVAVDVVGYFVAKASTPTPPPTSGTPPGDDVYDRSLGWITGTHPGQPGVTPGAITQDRALVLTGTVTTMSGAAYPHARVEVSGHPELGWTQTDANGAYKLVVNGGSRVLVKFSDDAGGALPIERWASANAQSWVEMPTVALRTLSSVKAPVTLSSGSPTVANLGTTSSQDCTDGSGTTTCARTNKLYVPSGTKATATMPDGSKKALSGTVAVRATEYTVGDNGPEAMPGDLPPQSAYTYAVDLTVDGSEDARTVSFTGSDGKPQQMFNYVSNFLQFPVGTHVPAAYYDSTKGQWMAARDGLVIKVLAISGGKAAIDLDGDGTADTPSSAVGTKAGLSDTELAQIGASYHAGDELWRVPITHFTPWDYNFPYGCKTVCKPPTLKPYQDPRFPDPCQTAGSVIGCENQSLGERVQVPDTSYSLSYDSSQTSGYAYGRHIHVPIASVVPIEADGYRVSVNVAGRVYSKSGVVPVGSLDVVWDGKDAFGNRVYGPVTATIQAVAFYQLVYKTTADDLDSTWAYWPADDSSIGVSRSQAQAGFSQQQTLTLDGGRPPGSVDNWGLDAMARYDVATQTEIFGDGSTRHVQPVVTRILSLGGKGDEGCDVSGEVNDCHDGGPITNAGMDARDTLAAGPDGSVFFYDENESRIRRITDPTNPDPSKRIITAVAGNGKQCSDTDGAGNSCLRPNGSPALQQPIGDVVSLSVAPDGTVYGSSDLGDDTGDNYVFALTPSNGTYTFRVVAGTGEDCARTAPQTQANFPNCGDGGPGAAAAVSANQVAAGADGVYFFDAGETGRFREILPDGRIRTAFGCSLNWTTGCSFNMTDGQSASKVAVIDVSGLAVAPDGTVWFTNTYSHRAQAIQVDTSGNLHLWGAPKGCSHLVDCGDGATMDKATFRYPIGLNVDASGRVYVTDWLGGGGDVVRVFKPGGTAMTVLGADTSPTGDLPTGQGARTTGLNIPSTAVLPDGQVMFTDWYQTGYIYTVDANLLSLQDATLKVPSPDGSRYSVFAPDGRELSENDALTNAVLTTFKYDDAGRISSITDAHGRTTKIVRNASGDATSIVAPSGATTALTVDADGNLASIKRPDGHTLHAAYSADGLLTSMTDFGGAGHTFTYDSLGRLTRDAGPNGNVQTLSCTQDGGAPCDGSGNQTTVTRTDADGARTTYTVKPNDDGTTTRTETDPSGATTSVTVSADGTSSTTVRPDGTREAVTMVPDERFGIAAPVLASDTVTRPSGTADTTTIGQDVTFANASDPYSAQKIVTKVTRNGNTTTSTWTWNGTTGTVTTTSPEGRTTSATFDKADRLTRAVSGDGATPTTYAYDAAGDLTAEAVGTHRNLLAYDASGHLTSSTSSAGVTTHYGYNADGWMDSATDDTGQTWRIGYDGNGNEVSMTTPRGTYQLPDDGSGRLTGFTMPGDSIGTTKSYDAAGLYTGLTVPAAGGNQHAARDYNAGEVLTKVSGGGSTTTLTPVSGSDLYSAMSWQAGTGPTQSLGLAYDGSTLTKQTFDGPASGTLTAQVGSSGTTSKITVAVGGTSVDILRDIDKDGLLTKEGPFTLDRSGPAGATTSVTDGTASYGQSVAGDGSITSRTLTVNGHAVFDEALTVNADREVTKQVIGGATTSFGYDGDGRLKSAGATTYSYDADGNLAHPKAGAASYDSADRITQAGQRSYTVDAAGRLVKRGNDTFSYDAQGHLVSATVGGTTATYVYDGLGRRTAETVSGGTAAQNGTTQYLYGDPVRQTQVTAVVEPDGSLDVLYHDDRGLLLGFDRDGTRYYVGTDHLGSPRVVADATGAVIKKIDYDAWGNVTSATAPAFTVPLGYAGGLPDPVTGFVHMGMRDYDPATARFTTRDPSLFDGGSNLFGYVGDDPTSATDPEGLGLGGGLSIYAGVGGGISFSGDENGITICGEAGFGVGESVEVNSEGYSKTSVSAGIEAGVTEGPLHGGISYAMVSGPCVPFHQEGVAKAGIGPYSVGAKASDEKGEVEVEPIAGASGPIDKDIKEAVEEVAKSTKGFGEKVEGKVYAKGCVGIPFG